MKKIFIIIFTSILITTSKFSIAQDVLKIAAIVNNQMISVYDLNMRITMLILFSRLPNNPETRVRIRSQVLQTMVDEELKLQEAKRISVKISDKEVDLALRAMERGNKLSKGAIKKTLKENKVDISVLHKRIKADLSWKELVNVRYGPTVVITDEEIDETLAQILNNEGKPEYRVSNIFLPLENPEDEKQVLEIANRMINQIKSGAKFSTLAKNFSKSATARNGGDMGWKRAGQLDQELDNILKLLKPGQISQPIRTIEGYYILYLKEQRIARKFGQPDPESATINLQQLIIPLAKNAGIKEVEKSIKSAQKIGQEARNCKELGLAAKKFNSPLSGNLGDLKINTLGLQQKRLIQKLPLMRASKPHRSPEGVMVLMVCRRDKEKSQILSISDRRNRIEASLRYEKLGTFTQQYLQQLRREAFLESRL
ncbi:MAG: peptidylprolyl isomerase [Pseudomonadota bacterium]|nr:peptidylprolyl isomerase [Pseudomonadota bacterium]